MDSTDNVDIGQLMERIRAGDGSAATDLFLFTNRLQSEQRVREVLVDAARRAIVERRAARHDAQKARRYAAETAITAEEVALEVAAWRKDAESVERWHKSDPDMKEHTGLIAARWKECLTHAESRLEVARENARLAAIKAQEATELEKSLPEMPVPFIFADAWRHR